MKGWLRPWRGLNLSLANNVPDARLVIWDGRSRWARDRIHEWWRLLVGAEVEVAARQRATYEMGPWDERGRVVEAWAEGGHLRLLLQPGGEIEVIAQRIDLDLRLGVLRAYTRVGRVLWVRRLGLSWQPTFYHNWGQALVRAYNLVLCSRVGYHLETYSWSSYLQNVVFDPRLGRKFCGVPTLEVTLPPSGRAEAGEVDLSVSSPLSWPMTLTGLSSVLLHRSTKLTQSLPRQELLLKSWKEVLCHLSGDVIVYSPSFVRLDRPWYQAFPSPVVLYYTLNPVGQSLGGIRLEQSGRRSLSIALGGRLRHWQGIWPIYSRDPVVANFFRSRPLRHGL